MLRTTSRCVARECAPFFLCIISGLFFRGGLVILLASLSIRHFQWMDVLNLSTHLHFLNFIGIFVMVIALFGAISGCVRWKLGLSIYAIVVSILILVFVVVVMSVFDIDAVVYRWQEDAYPANQNEVKVKTRFDTSWCYAQGAYICNSMTVDNAFQLFVPPVNKSNLLDNYKGINAVCDNIETLVNLVPEVKTVCDGCKKMKQVQNPAVLKWTNNYCPRTESTMLWCASYIIMNNTNDSVRAAPYTRCRKVFLNSVEEGSGNLVFECGFNVVCAVLVFCCTLCLRCRKRTEQEPQGLSSTPNITSNTNVEFQSV